MSEKEAKKRLNEILKEYQEIINIKDKEEREIEMSMYFEEMPFKEIQTILQLLEQKDNKIKELEADLYSANCTINDYIEERNKILEIMGEINERNKLS